MKIVSIILVAGLFLGGCSSKDENGFPECSSDFATNKPLKDDINVFSVGGDTKGEYINIVTLSTSKSQKECRATFVMKRGEKILHKRDTYYNLVKTDSGKILVEL
jgi:hypothetical protein